jgi:hypothetical protein
MMTEQKHINASLGLLGFARKKRTFLERRQIARQEYVPTSVADQKHTTLRVAIPPH